MILESRAVLIEVKSWESALSRSGGLEVEGAGSA